MDWIQAEIATNTDGIDILCGKLQMAGVNGFEIEDAAEFEEFLHHSGPHWDMVDEELLAKKTGSTCVKLYLSDPEQLAVVRAALAELRRDGDPRELGTLELRVTSVDEQDWANAWKKYYKPLRAGRSLVIRPFWEEYEPQQGDRVVTIDPGMAFGTGTHETTAMCLSLLEDFIKSGDRVLDVGCGSGILSIAALRLGAAEADAADIDPLAVKIARDNGARNGYGAEKLHVQAGSLTETARGRYHCIVSNIIADVIIALCGEVEDFLEKGGVWLCSGIIADREADVLAAFAQYGFSVLRREQQKEWLAFAVAGE